MHGSSCASMQGAARQKLRVTLPAAWLCTAMLPRRAAPHANFLGTGCLIGWPLHTTQATSVCSRCSWQRHQPGQGEGPWGERYPATTHTGQAGQPRLACLLPGRSVPGLAQVGGVSQPGLPAALVCVQLVRNEFEGEHGEAQFRQVMRQHRPDLQYGWASPELAEDSIKRATEARMPRPDDDDRHAAAGRRRTEDLWWQQQTDPECSCVPGSCQPLLAL